MALLCSSISDHDDGPQIFFFEVRGEGIHRGGGQGQPSRLQE
jgi:hypothetical protein